MNDIYFCGDIHGELKELVWTLVIKLNLYNASVVVVGDFGVGFGKPKYEDILYKKVESRLEKNNITIYTIRGNHDNPSYFDGTHNFPRLKFLKDFEVLSIGDKTILPIGGAVSLDPEWRIKENNRYERLGSSRRLWWPNEDITKVFKGLPNYVDIIVTHDGPLSFNPVTIRDDREGVTSDIWDKAIDTRKYLDYVLNNVRCNNWYFGHYHRSVSGTYGNVKYRCLDIMELYNNCYE